MDLKMITASDKMWKKVLKCVISMTSYMEKI